MYKQYFAPGANRYNGALLRERRLVPYTDVSADGLTRAPNESFPGFGNSWGA